MITAWSIFSGIGAMDYAAVCAFGGALDIKLMVEISAYKRSVLAKHAPQYWPNVRIETDVEAITPVGLADEIGKPDLLYGGFPCTNISRSGDGLGLSGTESRLWYAMLGAISAVRPRAIVLENVPAIAFRGGTEVVASLTQLGYRGCWYVIRANAFDAPLFRERWVYVGCTDRNRIQSAGDEHRPRQDCDTPKRDYPIPEQLRRNFAATPIRTRSANGASIGQPYRWVGGESAMDAVPDGNAAQLVGHRFPVGSLQPAGDWEPKRMVAHNRKTNPALQAVGDLALPQQLYPAFAALARLFGDGV